MKISWGVGITIAIVVFMLISFGLIYFSFNQDVNLVRDDYYEAEILYSNKIESLKRTKQLGEKLSIKIKDVFIKFTFPKIFKPTKIGGSINFYRPSNSNLDIVLPIELDSLRTQLISTKNMISGMWRIRVEWNVDSTSYFNDEIIMVQ